MANDPDPETPVSVSTGEVRVGKAFEADRFPVPAIAFEIESLADEPVRIRLVDQIPDSFAMEGVGFHPDYEGDNWTAYGDHRVAYERTLDPGESVLTVYGIRIDDPEEATAFLDEPTIELLDTDDTADGTGDVLGRETTQVVRDALSGEESGDLAELGSESLLGDQDGAVTPAPREPDEELTAALGDRDEDVTAVATSGAVETAEGSEADAETAEESEADAETAEESEADAETAEEPEADAETAEEPETMPSATVAEALDPRPADHAAITSDDTAAETATTPVTAGSDSVAAALAAEIRAGDVDDDDLSVLREAFEGEVPTSVDVRVGRLQSQVEDLLAYRDALADFLDENGTAEEVLGDVSEAVDDLDDRVDDLEDTLETAEAERDDLHDEVEAATDTVSAVSDRIDTVADDLTELEATAERLDDRLAAVEEFEADIEEIKQELDDLRSFRDRLSSAFGTDEG
ncbi:MAG: hypothetical protein ABEJ73_04885 [Haloplanus sp.]